MSLNGSGLLHWPATTCWIRLAKLLSTRSLAAKLCDVPIAVVNLIGDRRQFFKAEVGLGVRETSFESSFYAKAILEQDFLLVPMPRRTDRSTATRWLRANPISGSMPALSSKPTRDC